MKTSHGNENASRPRVIKPVVARFSNLKEMEKADRAWWHSLQPIERMQRLEFLRELNYGPQIADRRLSRFPQVSRRPRR